MSVSLIDGHIDEPKIACKDCIHYDICVFHTKGKENEKCSHFKNKANFVEVIRCKDCKHKGWIQEPCHGKTIDFCRKHDFCIRENDFCSYGERKESEVTEE